MTTTSSAESAPEGSFSRYALPSGATRSIARSPRQVCLTLTATFSATGALPATPETSIGDSAVPRSGMGTSVVFSNDVAGTGAAPTALRASTSPSPKKELTAGVPVHLPSAGHARSLACAASLALS